MPSITGQAAKGREESCLPLLLGEGRMQPQPPRQHPTKGHIAAQSSHLPCPVPITSPSPWWPRGARHRPVQPPVKGWELGRAKGAGVLPPPPLSPTATQGVQSSLCSSAPASPQGKHRFPRLCSEMYSPLLKTWRQNQFSSAVLFFFPPFYETVCSGVVIASRGASALPREGAPLGGLRCSGEGDPKGLQGWGWG